MFDPTVCETVTGRRNRTRDAGAILRRAVMPFRMIPEGEKYRLSGHLDLGVCVSGSSGGVI